MHTGDILLMPMMLVAVVHQPEKDILHYSVASPPVNRPGQPSLPAECESSIGLCEILRLSLQIPIEAFDVFRVNVLKGMLI